MLRSIVENAIITTNYKCDFGFEIFSVNALDLIKNLEILKEKLGFKLLLDIAVTDFLSSDLGVKDCRFGVFYILRNYAKNYNIALRVDIKENESLPSVHNLFKSAIWAQREAFDQFGIHFEGHENLKRILNHKDFVGHPLLKDYPITKYQMLHESDSLIDEIELALKNNGYTKKENEDFKTSFTFLNIGPSHPATHGTIRNLVAIDGEEIIACATEIGYLHRGFEKSCENHRYNQIVPYTDRLNYCSVMLNNVGYAKAIEDMLDLSLPDRAIFMRVILGELSRLMDHIVCLGAIFVDSGGLTNYWYLFNTREEIYSFLSRLTGARFTNSFTRIGGMANDFHNGWEAELKGLLKNVQKGVDDALILVGKNKIFLDRVQDICKISKEDALSFGLTGPNLRASGVDFDLRKDSPYYYYESFDFSVPIGTVGDIYDRVMVRFEEITQSISIINQAIKQIPKGDIAVKDKDIFLPPKFDTYSNIEGLINHFKLIYEGLKVPKGIHYSATEAANGELGFFVVSSNEPCPYRLKLRPPSFYAMNSYAYTIKNKMISDAVLHLGSLNIIAGELDR